MEQQAEWVSRGREEGPFVLMRRGVLLDDDDDGEWR